MIAKVYTYEIDRKNLAKWKRVTKAVNTIYQEYGPVTFERLVGAGSIVQICEISYYPNKKVMNQVFKKLGSDERVQKLYKQLSSIVKSKGIKEQSYERIKN